MRKLTEWFKWFKKKDQMPGPSRDANQSFDNEDADEAGVSESCRNGSELGGDFEEIEVLEEGGRLEETEAVTAAERVDGLIKLIREGKMIGSAQISAYAKTFTSQESFELTTMLNCYVRISGNRQGTNIDQIWGYIERVKNGSSPDIIMLPIALAAKPGLPFAEDHVALLIINKKTKKIQYYDPKGGDLSKETRELAVLPNGEMTGKAFLNDLKKTLKNEYQYECYKPKGFWATALGWIGLSKLGNLLSSHQGAFDRSSCGIYVSRAIEQYVCAEARKSITAGAEAGFVVVQQPLPAHFSVQNMRNTMCTAITNQVSQPVLQFHSNPCYVPVGSDNEAVFPPVQYGCFEGGERLVATLKASDVVDPNGVQRKVERIPPLPDD